MHSRHKTRIAMAKQKMVEHNNIWKDRGIPPTLKIKILKCLIWPVMLYGSDTWTCRKRDEERIEAAEVWFYRRLLRVQWTDKRTNESIFRRTLSAERTTCGDQQKKTKVHWPCKPQHEDTADEDCPTRQTRIQEKTWKTPHLVRQQHQEDQRPEGERSST